MIGTSIEVGEGLNICNRAHILIILSRYTKSATAFNNISYDDSGAFNTFINGRSKSSLLLGSLKIIRIASSLNNISYDDSGAFYSCYFIYYFCINITLHCTHKGDMFSPQSNEVSAKQKTDRMKDRSGSCKVQKHPYM